MNEWHILSLLVTFVFGFVSGVIYALRLYRRIEAESDREWAKRHGMPERYGMREVKAPYRGLPVGIDPILRRRIL
jgi:hypothetical protein